MSPGAISTSCRHGLNLIAADLEHVMPGADARGAEVRVGLLPRRVLHRLVVQPDEPARRIARQLEARVGRRLQRHGQRQRLPRLELDVLIVARITVARDRQRVGSGRLLDRHRRMVADLDVVDQDRGVAGRHRQLDPARLDVAVVPVDHCPRSQPPRPRAARTPRAAPAACAWTVSKPPVPNGASCGTWNRCFTGGGAPSAAASASACAAGARTARPTD